MRHALIIAILGLFIPSFVWAQEIPPGFMLIEGDMVVPVDYYTRNDSTLSGSLWPNGVVPYAFVTSGSGSVSSANQTRMRRAMNEWEGVADVRFVARTNELVWVQIQNSTANNSNVGYYVFGSHIINIQDWNNQRTLVHELGHTLGLAHEQTRPDRDDFVTIITSRIESGHEHNFDLNPNASTVGTYDFGSVMHYHQFAFTAESGLPTIVCNQNFEQFQNTIGMGELLSPLDALGMASRYGPPPSPVVFSVSPTTVPAGSGPFELTINGAHFYHGSSSPGEVAGTQVSIQGIPVIPTILSGLQMQVTVPAEAIAIPGAVAVQVSNPAPGGGNANFHSFTAACTTNSIGLQSLALATISAPCVDFLVTPTSSEWHVIAIGSTAQGNWDLMIGNAESNWPGYFTDFVVANGRNGAISPTSGQIWRTSGTQNTVAMHHPAFNATVGSLFTSTLAQGRVFKAYEFNVPTSGNYIVSLTGDSDLSGFIFEPGSNANWMERDDFDHIVGATGGHEVLNLPSGWHCIVILREGGAATTAEEFSLSIIPSIPPLSLGSNTTTVTTAIQPFTQTISPGVWNCVAATGSNWDLVIGTGESHLASNLTEIVVADDHAAGSINVLAGLIYQLSGTGSACAQKAPRSTIVVGQTNGPLLAFDSDYLARLIEFQVTEPGVYAIDVDGSSALDWFLFAPAADRHWRNSNSSIETGSVGGAPAEIFLNVGWHALVVRRNGCSGTYSAIAPYVLPGSNPVPVLSSVTPSSGVAGSSFVNVTCTGSGFVGGSVIRWNNTSLTTVFDSQTELRASLPASLLTSAGTGNITVRNPAPGGGTSAAVPFTVVHPVPTLSSISPATTTVETGSFTLTCTGSGFFPTSVVRWNGQPLATTHLSSTQLTAAVPSSSVSSSGAAIITVMNPAPGGGVSASRTLMINSPLPVLSILSPASLIAGSPAATVNLFGSGFTPQSTVTWDSSILLSVTYSSPSQLIATVPANLFPSVGTHALRVVNPTPGGGTSLPLTLAVNHPLPVLASITPNSAIAGQTSSVTLACSGSGFTTSSTVRLGGVALATVFGSATQLSATIPATLLTNVSTPGVVVQNPTPGGGISVSQPFSILHPIPTLTSLTPSTVSAGGPSFNVTVIGTGFNAQSAALWNGSTPIPTTVTSPTQLTAQVASSFIVGGGNFSLRVSNPAPGGGTSSALGITVNNPVPVLTSTSPTSATANGQSLTLSATGSNFNPTSQIRWNGSLRATTFVSSTLIRATITASDLAVGATVTVTVRNPVPAGGTSAPSTFTVMNPVPSITALTPSSAIAGGPALSLLVGGTGFTASSVVAWNGVQRATTLLSPTELSAAILASDLLTIGPATITVSSPAPGGGTTSESLFDVLAPTIGAITPSLIPIQVPGAPPMTLTVQGSNFLPGTSRVSANGTMLIPSTSSPTQLVVSVDPAIVTQASRAGGIAINVENAPPCVSNTEVLVVGAGSNIGTIRRHPLDPQPGQAYSGLIEGGHASAIVTLVLDLDNAPPIVPWPNAQVNLVLSVAQAGTFLALVDGFGLFGPPTGASLDGNGNLTIPGFVLPSTPFGIDLTLQAVYLDPTAPLGFTLTWARFPDRL